MSNAAREHRALHLADTCNPQPLCSAGFGDWSTLAAQKGIIVSSRFATHHDFPTRISTFLSHQEKSASCWGFRTFCVKKGLLLRDMSCSLANFCAADGPRISQSTPRKH